MRRTVTIESLALLVIGAVGLWGGLKSYIGMGAMTQSSSMKPGIYVLVLSVALIVTALAYVFFGFREYGPRDGSEASGQPDSQANRLVFFVFAAVAAYAVLIPWIGYLPSTVLFLLVQFYLLGVAPWWRSAAFAVGVSAVFYVVFIHYGEMIFPRGSLYD